MIEEKKINNKHARFQDADWYSQRGVILIGGAGGIGSWLSLFLGRIGHELHIYDDDVIDETNMAGQAYMVHQMGVNKAEATINNVRSFCGPTDVDLTSYGRFTEESEACPIMFSCFDNMAARKLMFEKWCSLPDRVIFIDGRMQAENGMVYTVIPGREEAYRSTLFEDSEVQEQPCSYKATSHCGALIASFMTSSLNNHFSNLHHGFEARVVDFELVFNLPLFNFEVNETPVIAQAEPVTTVAN